MLKKNNGDPVNCATNLLRLARFSVPFERMKGIGSNVIDRPATTAGAELLQDSQWILDTYEPRATLQGLTLAELLERSGIEGKFQTSASIKEKD